MKGLSGPQVPGAWRFRAMCLAAAVVLAALVLVLGSELPQHHRVVLSYIGLIGGGIAAALSCGDRYRRSVGRRRRAWWCLAMGGLIGALCNTWVLMVQLSGGTEAASNLANFGLVAALLLGMAGLILFPSVPRRGLELMRMVLDGVVIGGSVLTITSILVFPQLLSGGAVTGTERFLTLVLPFADVVLATLAGLLFLRSSADDRPALALASLGFVLYAVSDLAFVVLQAHQAFSFGSPVDVGWIAGYLFIALAARHRAAEVAHHERVVQEGSPVAGTMVMFAVFLMAALIRAFRSQPDTLSVTSAVVWMIVLIAVATRQIMLIIDNERLRQTLERRVAERTTELRRLTRRSELLLTSVADGIYGVNRAGMVTFINPVAARMLGFAAEDLIGTEAHASFHAPQADGTSYPSGSCYINEAVRDGRVSNAEEDVYLRADGRKIPVEVTASPLTSDSTVEGAVVVFRDVTQRREVDRLKSEFVSIVSHELRTPLTSIRGSLGLLSGGAMGSLPAGASRMIDIALDSSERLTRLINDILDIEQIESGALPMDVADHPAQQLVDAAIGQVQGLANEAGVALVTTSVTGRVHADADRVVQTLINLLGNAIKFSPTGSIVTVSAAARGNFIQFSVADHGRGIPTDKLEHVFTRFEQVDSSDAREKGGTGLGLAISRSLVDRLGGRIWAERNPAGGAIFRFTLPRISEVGANRPGGHGPLVVICNDDEYAVEALSDILQRRGYRAIGAVGGRDAVELITAEQPAAVLMDLAMPEISGADVVAAMRRLPQTRDIPVVVLSDLSAASHPGLAAQAAGWLIKPVDEERLSQTVAAAIADHPTRGTVLLVEDDADLASVIRTMFERRGLTVYYAATKAEAMVHCGRIQPQVLVLDLHLPDGNGAEVVAELRRNRRLSQLPVVVYSAVDIGAAARGELSLGPTLFLTKGRVPPQELEDRVVELIDSAAGRALAAQPVGARPDPVGVRL